MAYTMLSYLPTHVGLYVSIFPVIMYVFFGTSKHLSMGEYALDYTIQIIKIVLFIIKVLLQSLQL
jgi:MFS superfamily sulfate permease-like transporter